MNEELKWRAKRCSDSSVAYNFMQGVVLDLLAECERLAQPIPPPCCGNFAKCHIACVPRGEWIAEQRLGKRITELESLAARVPSAEPVAWYWEGSGSPFGGTIQWGKSPPAALREWLPLYTAPRAPSVPDGWKLVPIKATPEMLAVKASPMLVVGSPDNSRVQQWRAGIYAAMLAAAPEAPKP